jgi:hypothetical protein
MAINYSKVGWNSGSYLGPTNFNHMDEGIKAACDQADENAADIISINESLAKLAIATHNPTVYSANFGSGSITLYRQGRIAFGNVYITAAQALGITNAYALMATITDPAFYPSENTLVRCSYNASSLGQIRAIKSLTSGGTTYTNQIIIGYATANVASGAIVSFPIMYVCDGD